MDCNALLQGIFPTQGLNPGLLPLQAETLPPEPPGKPIYNAYTHIHILIVYVFIYIWLARWLSGKIHPSQKTHVYIKCIYINICIYIQETWVWSLGREDPLEKEMATHSSILAWKVPWTEEPGGPQSTGLQRVRRDWATENNIYIMYIYKHTHISQLLSPDQSLHCQPGSLGTKPGSWVRVREEHVLSWGTSPEQTGASSSRPQHRHREKHHSETWRKTDLSHSVCCVSFHTEKGCGCLCSPTPRLPFRINPHGVPHLCPA